LEEVICDRLHIELTVIHLHSKSNLSSLLDSCLIGMFVDISIDSLSFRLEQEAPQNSLPVTIGLL